MSHSPRGQTRTVVIITPEWVLVGRVGKHLSEIPDEQTIYGTHKTCEELDPTAYATHFALCGCATPSHRRHHISKLSLQ